MGREIKSPSASASASGDNLVTTANGRKKLQVHFIESDDRRGGVMARSYASAIGAPGGTTPVDIHGRPLSDSRLRKTGGWLPTFFIFGNEMAERLAYFGLSVNMVAFMFYVMHRPFSSSANAVNIFLGISQASSVVGGFLADAYLGRYWTIAIFSTIYLAGLTGVTLGATMKVLVPNQEDCDQIALLLGNCEPAKPWQMLYLNAVLYLTGFGAAGIRPCVSSFGADQFDETSEDYKSHLERFFNAFYLAVTLGAILAFTAVVYIQMEHGWGSAFGSIAIAMAVSNVLFFIGTPTYRHRLPGGSPLTRVTQVLVAAFRKRKAPFSSSEIVGLYELPGKVSTIKGSRRIPHTDGFRCLDKAALQLKEDASNPSPWKLCTVTQVEEVKILIRMIPVSACTIMLSLVLTEFLTLSVQQAYTLNTHLGRLKVPVTCMPVFPCISIFAMLSLYYSVFVPLSRRLTGNPHGVSQLQRIGIGLALSVLSVAWAGVFERFRRNYAIKHDYEAIFLTPMPDLSAYWLLIQYCLIGIAEVFCIVGLLEFLYEEAPDALRSIGSAYAAVAGGFGCFGASLLNNIVKSTSGTEDSNWLPQNINQGKFDYFYWLLTLLSLVNFFGFLYAARKYKYRRTDGYSGSSV